MRTLEAGLDVKWRSDYDGANRIDKRLMLNEIENEDDTLNIILISVMTCGTVLSVLMLIFEYFWFKYLKEKFCNIKIYLFD